MTENLHDLLQRDDPTALRRIERALQSQDDLSADQEAVLGALVWQRCTSGAAGLLGCVLHHDCAKRIDDLPDQLAHIGAGDAALATRALRDSIAPDKIGRGMLDWIDTRPDIVNRARELANGLDEADQAIWDFMKEAASDIPDLEIPTRSESVVSSVLSRFRSSNIDPA